MREIKFRAWCNYERKMYNKFYIEEHMTYAFFCELIESAKERYDLMQYTGLKDKNGTEIYEGDIVKFNDYWGAITGGDVGDTIRTCFVQYIISGFFLVDVIDEEYEEDLGMALINADELEVIGNIYEHKHLLEREK